MSNELAEKVIFLTGGANDIGRECARANVREGARVVIADIDYAAALETEQSLCSDCTLPAACDVSLRDSVEQAIQKTLEHFWRLNAVHLNTA